MEKMNTESANKIFEKINESWNDCIDVKYRELDEVIKFYYNISIIDIQTIVSIVVGACTPTEQYEPIKTKAVLARCIIEYLTDLPVPIMETQNEDGDSEEIEDYLSCYEFIYGRYGILQYPEVNYVVGMLEHLINNEIGNKMRYQDPQNMLASRILEIGREIAAGLEDALNNPDSELNKNFSEFMNYVEDRKGSVS